MNINRNIILLLLTVFITTFKSVAQESEVYARFIIQDARINKTDVSEQWVKQGAYLAFYINKDSEKVSFANVNPTQKTQSFGTIFDLETTTEEESDATYKQEIFTFNWSYTNDYDKKKGTAKVELIKIHKEAGIAFTCTIVPEDLDVLVYKGYMEGSIKPLN